MDRLITPLAKVRQFAQDTPLAYLKCRDEHDWRDLDAYVITSRADPLCGAEYESKRCFKCKGEKERWVSPKTGRVLKQKRKMPEGYARKGEGRISRDGNDALRQAYFERLRRADAQSATRLPRGRGGKTAAKKPARKGSLTSVDNLFREPKAKSA